MTARFRAHALRIKNLRAQGFTFREIDENFLPQGWRSRYILRRYNRLQG